MSWLTSLSTFHAVVTASRGTSSNTSPPLAALRFSLWQCSLVKASEGVLALRAMCPREMRTPETRALLLHALGLCGDWRSVLAIGVHHNTHNMSDADVIEALGFCGRWKECLKVYQRRKEDNDKSLTRRKRRLLWAAVVPADRPAGLWAECLEALSWEECVATFLSMRRESVDLAYDNGFTSAFVSRMPNYEMAMKVLGTSMHLYNASTLQAVVRACQSDGDVAHATAFVAELSESGVLPDEETLRLLLLQSSSRKANPMTP